MKKLQRETAAHLSLDVAHALVVQLGRRAHLEDEPRAHVVVDVIDDGERQQKEADEDPALVHQHVVQAFEADPEQEQHEQAAQVEQQRGHGRFAASGRCFSLVRLQLFLLELECLSVHASVAAHRPGRESSAALIGGNWRGGDTMRSSTTPVGQTPVGAGPRGLVPSCTVANHRASRRSHHAGRRVCVTTPHICCRPATFE